MTRPQLDPDSAAATRREAAPAGLPGSSPLGLHRVLEPAGVLPQAARRLDARADIWDDEVRIGVQRLNLDAASFRQLHEAAGGDPAAIKSAVLEIVASRGKMQNPVTGSGGMLTGVVEEVGPNSPLGLAPGDRVATLVSLSLTPLVITDGLERWDGQSEQVPCAGHAILFGRSIAAVLPDDLPAQLALAVLDVCGAPALTHRVVGASPAGRGGTAGPGPVVAILGAAGKSGSLSAAAARQAGASKIIGVVPHEAEAALLRATGAGASNSAAGLSSAAGSNGAGGSSSAAGSNGAGGRCLVDEIVVADARDPVGVSGAIRQAGGPADVTVVCVDVPGCEGGAILATASGGTVIFFSMATSFSAAALGAEGVAADVTMLVGNGYVPGHAELALDLIRTQAGVRALFDRRID